MARGANQVHQGKPKASRSAPLLPPLCTALCRSRIGFIMDIEIATNADLGEDEVIDLYRANAWSAADKPAQLLLALKNSHTLVTARISDRLVGIANAISDGHLVVYYPHMLVHPEFQKRGIGRRMMAAMQSIYENYHQQMLTADGEAVQFYEALGFKRAGKTEAMWIYGGEDH